MMEDFSKDPVKEISKMKSMYVTFVDDVDTNLDRCVFQYLYHIRVKITEARLDSKGHITGVI